MYVNVTNITFSQFLLLKVPSSAPERFQVVEKGSAFIIVKWKSILGQLSGYRIRYKKAGSSQYTYMEISHWKSQVDITSLEKNTVYDIQVAGYTEDGTGPYSEKITERTKNGNGNLVHQLF